MSDSLSIRLAQIRNYCAQHAAAVLFDEPGGKLMDVFSVKELPLNARHLTAVEGRQNRQTHQPYLLLVYGDGRQLALSEAGIAFPPNLCNSGPLPQLSEVVCWRDFRGLLDRLKHELYGHPDHPPSTGALELVRMCIAVLDGARSAGFKVDREERELEVHLEELEKRAPITGG